jgi:hypothetical protein
MEVHLINDVVLEGIVVRDPWKFMDDLFFRLLIYRDCDLPAKKLDLENDAGDYVNIRLNGGANGLIQIRRGMRLRVHGFIQSRDYRENLEEIINKARKSRNCSELAIEIKDCNLKPNQILIDRNLVEAVARRIIVLNSTSKNGKKTRTNVRPATARDGEVEDEPGKKIYPAGEMELTEE